MAKFYGVIGYVETVETEPGVWNGEKIVEKNYYGDLTRNHGKTEGGGGVNPNINISNEINIVSDPYAMEHFLNIRYVKFKLPKLGGVWSVSSVEVAYPKLILSIGGVYNGNTLGTSE